MANIKITDLTAYTDPASTDVLPIVDVGADATRKVSIADLLENAGSGTEALPGIAFDGDSNTGIYRPGADQLAISTNGTGRLYIASDGKVGVGTTSPGSKLEILGSDAEDLLHLSTGNAAGNTFAQIRGDNSAGIRIRGGGSYEGGTIELGGGLRVTDPGIIKFSTGTSGSSTEKARFDSSGRLLVGTSTSIGQNATTQIRNDSNGYGLSLQRSGDTTNPIRFLAERSRGSVGTPTALQDDDQIWEARFYGYDGSAYSISSSISAEVDGTPGANDMPGRLVFSTTSDSASSPTERLRITSDAYVRLASGTGGIQFNGDTAAANALDDYEEGTFTPFLYSDTGGEWPGKITESGSYTKIGRLVHCQGFVEWSSKAGGASGTVRFRGLPFGSTGSTDPAPYIRFGSTELFDAIRIQSAVVSSHFRVGGAAASSGDFQSSGKIYFNFAYRIS